MPETTINGFRLAYEVSGSGHPLLFIHGGFGGIETRFAPAQPWWVEDFARHYTVITYDRRGCGRSAAPEDGYTIATFAEDARALLDHLGYERAHIMASSAGGPIAMEFALTHTARTSLLVLVNTAANLLVGEQGAILRARLNERAARGWEALPEPEPGADAAEQVRIAALRAQILALSDDVRRDAFAAWQRNVAAYEGIDLSERLYDLRHLFTYIIHGTADDLVPPAGAERIAPRIRRATMRLRSGEPHGLLARPSSEAAGYILEWLTKMDALLSAGALDDPEETWAHEP